MQKAMAELSMNTHFHMATFWTYSQRSKNSNPLCPFSFAGYISSIPTLLKSPLLPCLLLCSWFALYLLNNWSLFWFPIRCLGSSALSSRGSLLFLMAHHTAQSVPPHPHSLPSSPSSHTSLFLFHLDFMPLFFSICLPLWFAAHILCGLFTILVPGLSPDKLRITIFFSLFQTALPM